MYWKIIFLFYGIINAEKFDPLKLYEFVNEDRETSLKLGLAMDTDNEEILIGSYCTPETANEENLIMKSPHDPNILHITMYPLFSLSLWKKRSCVKPLIISRELNFKFSRYNNTEILYGYFYSLYGFYVSFYNVPVYEYYFSSCRCH